MSRNPLKSGQCFLQVEKERVQKIAQEYVAIPSNRVNVSYLMELLVIKKEWVYYKSQSPQIGSMFLTFS